MFPVLLSYKVLEGSLKVSGRGCSDVILHDQGETYLGLSGHDRFTVNQDYLSPACKFGTTPRDKGVIAHSIFVGRLPQAIRDLLTTL